MNDYPVLAHISDLHFGTEDKFVAETLVHDINESAPDLVILSGDLTQRARKGQFKKAKTLLDAIEPPVVVIPGNHDIPLFNLMARFLFPYRNYEKYISNEEYPIYQLEHLAIAGVDTCSPFRHQSGKIKQEDIDYLVNFFSASGEEVIKGVVIHHNLFPYKGMKSGSALKGADFFLHEMNRCGVDLVFAGHLHRSFVSTFSQPEVNNHLIVLQAGTAISKRLRKEENYMLIIKPARDDIAVEFRTFKAGKFRLRRQQIFSRRV
jgi:3',5'-cyclic AMP phosphodiesterase CpdA